MAEDGTSALQEAVDSARKKLQMLDELTADQRTLFLDWTADRANAKAALDSANEARRAANPLRKQMSDAEAYHKRMLARRAKTAASLEQKQDELDKLHSWVAELHESLASDDAEVAKAAATVATLAAQNAAEKVTKWVPKQ